MDNDDFVNSGTVVLGTSSRLEATGDFSDTGGEVIPGEMAQMMVGGDFTPRAGRCALLGTTRA